MSDSPVEGITVLRQSEPGKGGLLRNCDLEQLMEGPVVLGQQRRVTAGGIGWATRVCRSPPCEPGLPLSHRHGAQGTISWAAPGSSGKSLPGMGNPPAGGRLAARRRRKRTCSRKLSTASAQREERSWAVARQGPVRSVRECPRVSASGEDQLGRAGQPLACSVLVGGADSSEHPRQDLSSCK